MPPEEQICYLLQGSAFSERLTARFLLLKRHRKNRRKRREGRKGGRGRRRRQEAGKDCTGKDVLGHEHCGPIYCSAGLVSELEGVGA